MSKPKHTPGPWIIEHDREFDECIIYAEREEERVVICEVGTYVTVSDKDHRIDVRQIKANAKLLSDAWKLPELRREIAELKEINKEMYEALKCACDQYCIGYAGDSIIKCEDCVINNALRKAKGEGR